MLKEGEFFEILWSLGGPKILVRRQNQEPLICEIIHSRSGNQWKSLPEWKSSWEKSSGHPMKFLYTHGGLECGVLMGKFPHLQAISIEPEIRGAHTTEERVQVESVKKYYEVLKEIIRRVSKTS